MKITGNENTVFILKELGNRFKDSRIAFPMTREELAEKSGVSLSTINRFENGKGAGLEQVLSIMRALNLLHSIDSLIPEYVMTPIDIASGKAKRKRATTAKNKSSSDWKWGDDK